jgi:hypothetical protein
VQKSGVFGDNANKPSQRNSSSTKETDLGALPTDATPVAAPNSRYHRVDWFHRLQMEGLGIRRRQDPENKADGGAGSH